MTPAWSRHDARSEARRGAFLGSLGRTTAAKAVRAVGGVLVQNDVLLRQTLVSVAVSVLLTGIGVTCILTNVLDGHPTVYALP